MGLKIWGFPKSFINQLIQPLSTFSTYQRSFHISSRPAVFHSDEESRERVVLVFNVYHVHQILGPIAQPFRMTAESQRRSRRVVRRLTMMGVMEPGHPHPVQPHLGLHTTASASAKHCKPSQASRTSQTSQNFSLKSVQ